MFALIIEDVKRFIARVEDTHGKTVYNINGREIIQSQVMRDERDISGLTKYLRKRKVLQYDDSIEYAASI